MVHSQKRSENQNNLTKWADRGRRTAACLLLLCILVTGLVSGCSTGDQGAEETASTITETQETSMPETAEETTAPVETTESEPTVKEWLVMGAEPRDAWIVSFGALNVRRFCYAKATVVGSFDAGQKILVTGPARYGFYPVSGTDVETGEDIRGYCSEDYVSFLEYTGPAVKLDIVKYKQTDDRWGKLTMGESRYTLAEIGCTTTCFAMCESYLNDTKIEPDDMMEQLTYSREGNLYWPEGYTQNYGSDYLAKIYQKLHQGIPVLIGSRRRSGGQHWVLVTGYDPGDKEITKTSQLKASDFLINDPGAGRRNLGEFFRDLPNFIKFAYYTGYQN